MDGHFSKKVNEIDDWFEDAREISDKTFSILESELASLQELIERDKEEK